jgi:RHS repeat-associated protein
MNRLISMSSPADPSGCTGLSWTDDAWANRTAQTVTGGTCGQSSLTINTSNHITNPGFGYDADGNLTSGTSPYQYDAEDRLTQFNNGPSNGGANYVYDANGRRIEKVISSGQIHYFYDENGNVIVETDQNGNWTKDYIYMAGRRVAELSGGQTYFIHADHLGSTRTVTNYAGSVTDSLDYLPYGEQIAGGSFTSRKYTGYERDAESGLDYASARYYNPTLGRFVSVDPARGNSADPQSFNRYAYVGNAPCSQVDPTGLSPCTFNVNIQGASLLTPGQLQTAEDDFRRAISANGSDLNVQFTTKNTNNGSDFSLLLKNYGTLDFLFGSGVTQDTYGQNGRYIPLPWITNSARVFVNNIAATGANIGVAVGNTMFHEFTHFGTGQYDPTDRDKQVGGLESGPQLLNDPNLTPTADQIAQFQAKCNQLHPQQSAPTVGASAGGSGSTVTSGLGNTTVFTNEGPVQIFFGWGGSGGGGIARHLPY